MPSKTVLAALKAVKKLTGDNSASVASDQKVEQIVGIPTGVDAIDNYGIQCGGLPAGRMSEVYSLEGMGKTAFSVFCMANVQKIGGIAVYIETEKTITEKRLSGSGVDTENLIRLYPETIEEAAAQINVVLNSLPEDVPILIVWDSIAATVCKKELQKIEDPEGANQPGVVAAAISSSIRFILPILAKRRAHLMCINQVRSKIGSYGNPETTPGGHAIKFYAALRMRIGAAKGSSGAAARVMSETNDVIGMLSSFTFVKNKVGFPNRVVDVKLDFMNGYDNDWMNLRLAKKLKLLQPSARSAQNAKEALIENNWSAKEEIVEEVVVEEKGIEAAKQAIKKMSKKESKK